MKSFSGYILLKKHLEISWKSCSNNVSHYRSSQTLHKVIRIGAYNVDANYTEWIKQPDNVYINLLELRNIPKCVKGKIELRATFQHYTKSRPKGTGGRRVVDRLSGSVDSTHNASAFTSYAGWPSTHPNGNGFSSIVITVNLGCSEYDVFATGKGLDFTRWVNRLNRDADKEGSVPYDWYQNE